MRRLTAWIGGVASGVVAYRVWRRHSQASPEPTSPEPTSPESDDRAEELRSKLAEARAEEPVVAESPPEPVAEVETPVEPESPDDRRRRVHEEGRATLDEMHSDGAGE